MKHLVIDARIIETSTGRYMQRLLENLHDHHVDKFRYTVLIPSKHVPKWSARLPKFSVIGADQKWYTISEQWSFFWLLRSLKADLVHFTMPQQPLLYFSPAVTTIHDTILLRIDNIDDMNPYVYKFKKAVFTFLVRVVISRAKGIFTPTQRAKQDLVDFSHTAHLEKIHVTPLSGEPSDDPVAPIEVLENQKYFVFIGNAFPYKNIQRIIDAFAVFKESHPDYHLALAGKKEFFYEELENKVVERGLQDVHFLGFISDGEKRWVLQNAVAFITASKEEGFGIPLFEAMYENCPALSSNASCLPEVGGDAALYFNPDSTEELVALMERVSADETLRQELIQKGKARVSEFSWKKTVELTMAVYKDVTRN